MAFKKRISLRRTKHGQIMVEREYEVHNEVWATESLVVVATVKEALADPYFGSKPQAHLEVAAIGEAVPSA
jgi:hypothetical protein